MESPEELVKTDCWPHSQSFWFSLRWGPRICISSKFSGHFDAVGQHIKLTFLPRDFIWHTLFPILSTVQGVLSEAFQILCFITTHVSSIFFSSSNFFPIFQIYMRKNCINKEKKVGFFSFQLNDDKYNKKSLYLNDYQEQQDMWNLPFSSQYLYWFFERYREIMKLYFLQMAFF